jgi:hypothetical protein
MSRSDMRLARLGSAFIFVCSVVAIGCHHHDDRNANYVDDQPGGQFGEVVAQRATFDLSCSRDQITVQPIGGDAFGVTGCNQKASYNCICMWHSWSTCTKPVCELNSHMGHAPATSPSTTAPAIEYSNPPSAPGTKL